ncbi:MAG: hypothetical protein KKE44_04855 [Proteobacteria bacterium]|nr:hypothetical protein [Pseudomonadota bacterium]MBU1582062.1 hypothetical protein [Pseudomonadota bacterium]MBU2452126.1 hypothetical protein [Pseudomonadota bacterium]MBU2628365.1 hypothetical protein [Pseudomonadota bacterium]
MAVDSAKLIVTASANSKVPVYVMVRHKEPVAKVLKLLRKGQENPDIAVSDELGLTGVLDRIKEDLLQWFRKQIETE